MAGTTIRNILASRVLSGTIQSVKPGLAVQAIPSGLMTPGETVPGDTCTVYQVDGTRKVATACHYDAPAKRRSLSGVREQSLKLLHVKDAMGINATTVMNLESQDGNREQMGQSEVNRQLAECRQISDNTRVAAVQSMFAVGSVNYLNGNFQNSTSGATLSVSANIPSTNINQLALNTGTSIITASWALAATDIVTQVLKIRLAMQRWHGYIPMVAMYGVNIPGYLRANDYFHDQIIRNVIPAAPFDSGEIPQGLMGLKWAPAYQSFFEDETGTIKTMFDDDSITFIPDPSIDWYELKIGTTPIPSNYGTISGDIAGAMNAIRVQGGMFAYAYETRNPVGAEMIWGDTFHPWIKVPNAVAIGKVANF